MKKHIPTEICDKCRFNEDPIEKLIRKIVKEILDELGILQAIEQIDRVAGELHKLEEKYNVHTHTSSKPNLEERKENVRFCTRN